jgi:hypothetical protein
MRETLANRRAIRRSRGEAGLSDRGPTVALVRLRPLSEAECYARCYGERGDAVSSISLPRPLDHRLPLVRDPHPDRPAAFDARREAA